MASVLLLAIIACLALYKAYKWSTYKPPGFPPGPPRIPIFGSYWIMLLLNHKHLHLAAEKLGKYYKTKLLGLWLGPFPTVVAHDHELIKDSIKRPEFDGKPDVFLARMRDPKEELRGIFFQEGELWKNQRWFMLRYMRDYGFGRRHDELEAQIDFETREFINLIKEGPKFEHENEYFKPGFAKLALAMAPSLLNSFFQVVLSERVPRENQADIFEVAKRSITFQYKADSYGKLLSIVPWLRHILPNQLTDEKTLRWSFEGLYKFMSNLINKQIQTYDPNHQRNFIDMYIKEMKAAEAKGEKVNGFFYEQFIFSLMDFFIPAITAIAAQMSLLLLTLVERPDVVKKMRKEIEHHVGSGRLPNLDDRPNLAYVEATIRENMRFDTPVPSGLPHKVLEDTELGGYKLEKDTLIIYSHYEMNMDKKLWGDPEVFRPERFLDNDGKLSLKADITIPFGAGKRLCAGETHARNLMFLYTAALVQNFNFHLPDVKLSELKKQTTTGIIKGVPPFWLRFEQI